MTENLLVLGDFGPSDQVFNLMADSVSGRPYRPGSLGVLPFRLGVDTALALCNHSLTFVYVDVSMRSHRVKINRQATH
jgi:hypothetical protein